MSAGKGDKLRKGANLAKYRNNYDQIFRKRMKIELQSYEYACSDEECGCYESGITCFIDGEEFGQFATEYEALKDVLEKKFNVEVELE